MSFNGNSGPRVTDGGGLSTKPIPSYLCSEQAVSNDSIVITVTAWDRTFNGPQGRGLKPIGWIEAEHRIKVRKSLSDGVRSIFTQIYNAREAERVPIYSGTDSNGVDRGLQGFNFRCKRPCEAGYGGAAKCLAAVARDSKACRHCLSAHAQAMAFDINPAVNPFRRKNSKHPEQQIVNPNWDCQAHPRDCLYAIRATDVIYAAFISHGWYWGGLWTRSKDFMHFSKNDE